MTDYSNTIIYKIICKDKTITECYVGHTTDFTKRKNGHKSKCNNPNDMSHNYYVYQFIRANGGWKNWDIIEIEKYPCNDVLEATKKERYWIETLQSKLNQRIPTRTDSEYYQNNREIILENVKKYSEENKEKRIIYLEENKEQIAKQSKEYREKNKEYIAQKEKEYREKNKEKISKQQKEYREKNREKINTRKRLNRLKNKS